MMEVCFWVCFGACAVVAAVAGWVLIRIGVAVLREAREARFRDRETARIRAEMSLGGGPR